MPDALLYPMAAHVGLTVILYVLLTAARAPTVWGVGRAADGSNPWAALEQRVSANLSNQFEWPLFFHVACLLLLQRAATDGVAVGLAWAFVTGRMLHSLVQILTTNLRMRGLVFTINFAATLGLWVLVVLR